MAREVNINLSDLKSQTARRQMDYCTLESNALIKYGKERSQKVNPEVVYRMIGLVMRQLYRPGRIE